MGVDDGIKLGAGLYIALSGDLDELFEATYVKSPLNKKVIKKEIEEYLEGKDIASVFIEIDEHIFSARKPSKMELFEFIINHSNEQSEEEEDNDEEMEEEDDDNATITVEHMEEWRKANQKNLKTKKEFWDAYNTELFNFVNTL